LSEKPSGGKVMMLPAVNDAPSTTMVGADSRTTVVMTKAQMMIVLERASIICVHP